MQLRLRARRKLGKLIEEVGLRVSVRIMGHYKNSAFTPDWEATGGV